MYSQLVNALEILIKILETEHTPNFLQILFLILEIQNNFKTLKFLIYIYKKRHNWTALPCIPLNVKWMIQLPPDRLILMMPIFWT